MAIIKDREVHVIKCIDCGINYGYFIFDVVSGRLFGWNRCVHCGSYRLRRSSKFIVSLEFKSIFDEKE